MSEDINAMNATDKDVSPVMGRGGVFVMLIVWVWSWRPDTAWLNVTLLRAPRASLTAYLLSVLDK